MSEQTPDTENGMAEGQDPSMEDILASIRKIIAEDDVQAPAGPETVIAEVVPDAPTLSGDVSDLGHVETLDLDIIADEAATAVDPDIEALIGDMDAAAPDNLTPNLESAVSSGQESLDDILDLEIPMDETESFTEIETPEAITEVDLLETETLTLEDDLIDLVAEPEQDIPEPIIKAEPKAGLMGGALAAMGLAGSAAIAKTDDVTSEIEPDSGDDLSLMLDNMLEDSESYKEASRDFSEDRIIDPAEDLIVEEVNADDILAELDFVEDDADAEAIEGVSKNDPDIDLVKSLMADLTETPLHDDAELVESAAESSMLDENDESEASSDDILDEILSVTIDDEAKLSEEISIPETPASSVEDTPSESLSLKDIAAAAEADADALTSESGMSASVVAGLGAAAIGGVAAVTAQDDSLDIDPQDSEAVENSEDDVDATLSELDNLLAEDSSAETVEDLIPESASSASPEPETPEHTIEEIPEMPRAKKSEAIIDEVTETATAGAFASLNQVVEEKATVADRGDRIGDLVMEAMQPMLKEWLDANLKGIVERAVTKEVKRISSRK